MNFYCLKFKLVLSSVSCVIGFCKFFISLVYKINLFINVKITCCKLLFILIISVPNVRMYSQSVIAGEIVDRNNMPVPVVQIDFNDGLEKILSDENGKFLFSYSDTLKKRKVRFQAFGYKIKTMQINKGQGKLKVVLVDSLYNLKTVTVTAPKYGRFSDYSAQTIQMSTFDIVTNPSAMADMIGNMRVLPGVQTNDNDGRLIIQGGSPDESQIYINDLIVMNPYTLSSKNSGTRSRFSSDLFEGVALQSGGFNAEFGQALSGIVNLNTKEKEYMEAKTDIAVSSVFTGVTHIEQKPSYAYRASLQYSNLEPYDKLFPSGYNWNKYYRQVEGDFFFTKTFSPKTKMTAQMNFSTSGGDYSYSNVDSIQFDNNMKETYFYAQVNLYHKINTKFTLSLGSNLVTDQFSGTEIQYKNDKIDNLNVWNHNKANIQYAFGKWTNRMGIEYIYNPFKETYTLGPEYKTNINNDLMSLYNDTKLFLTNNLTLSLGLRGEYSGYLKQFNLAPRVYAGYRLNRKNIVSASIGEYFQLPSMNYLKLTNTIDFTSVTKGTLSYGYVEKSSKFQLDAYYKKYKNAVTYSGGSFYPVDIRNAGKGNGWGANVFWKSNFKILEYWLTYSYDHTKKQYAYFPGKVAPSYVSPHSFNITLKYWAASLKSLLGVGYHVSSGVPYYGDSSPYEKLGTTPFHNRLDVSWSFLPKSWIIIHFGCQNVLGYKNIYGYEYSGIHPDLRKEIANPDKRFLFLGVFITFSHNKKLNQLKNL